jgi:hypothetical protein
MIVVWCEITDFGTRNPPNPASLNQQLAEQAEVEFSEHRQKWLLLI